MFPSAASNLTSQFTGKERDAETGLDYFMARYFSSAQGRFTSPDPLLASARLTDPQTWNRYAYVRNDPVNMIDPDGRAVINPSAYQFYQSQFLTGNDFNAWFNQAMGNNTMADYNAMVASYGLATIPGYAAADPTFVTYLASVDQGQDNLAAEEARNASLDMLPHIADVITAFPNEKISVTVIPQKVVPVVHVYPSLIKVDNKDPYTLGISIKDPYYVATYAKDMYSTKYRAPFNVSDASLAFEIWAHAFLYARGAYRANTQEADCGEYDADRAIWDKANSFSKSRPERK